MNGPAPALRFYERLGSDVLQQPAPLSIGGVTLLEYSLPRGEVSARTGVGQFGLHMAVAGETRLRRKIGARWEVAQLGPGAITLSPPDYWSLAEWDNRQSRFTVYFTRAALISLSGREWRDDDVVGIHGDLDLQDRQISVYMDALRAKFWDKQPAGRTLALEALATALCVDLLNRHSDSRARWHTNQVTPGVDWRLRRAIEFLETNLPDEIGLVAIAGTAGVSPAHLTNLFRAGTGQTPHRWLMDRRVDRACEMLVDPRRSITEIAAACGFASSQHLATVFRKRLGTTPSEYRKDRLS